MAKHFTEQNKFSRETCNSLIAFLKKKDMIQCIYSFLAISCKFPLLLGSKKKLELENELLNEMSPCVFCKFKTSPAKV